MTSAVQKRDYQHHLRTRKMMWWYEQLLDWMIDNPDKTKAEAARHFNVTANSLSLITNSDVFKHKYAMRLAERRARVDARIVEAAGGVAIKGLSLIQDRLNRQDASKTSLSTLAEVTDSALKALGYGNPKSAVTINNVNQVVSTTASPDAVAAARNRIRELQGAPVPEVSYVELDREDVAPSGQGEGVGSTFPTEAAETPLGELFDPLDLFGDFDEEVSSESDAAELPNSVEAPEGAEE